MFPGYIFCRFDAANLYRVLNIRGVVDVASAGKKLLPLEEEEVINIQTICRAGLRTVPWPFLQGGRRVRIDQGPLAGIKGIVLQQSDACRIVVSVSILQRSVSAEIEPAWI
jgi:transcription antitermination factor NusG